MNASITEIFPSEPGRATLHILPPRAFGLSHPLREDFERLRAHCYCDLLGWEQRNYWGFESDRFDPVSVYGYITVQGKGRAGFRLIPSVTPNYRLPIEIEFGISLPRPCTEASRVIMGGGKSIHLIDGFYRGMCMAIASRDLWRYCDSRGCEMSAYTVAQPWLINELQRRFGDSIRQVPGTGVVEKITPTGKTFSHMAGEISVPKWRNYYQNQQAPVSLVA